MILKSIFAAAVAAPLLASGAFAGEGEEATFIETLQDGAYANIENNVGWTGGDYTGALTEFHVGYDYEINDSANVYLQGGPALVAVDGEETETEFSAYLGGEVAATESVSFYGELGYLTGEEDSISTEVGVTWDF